MYENNQKVLRTIPGPGANVIEPFLPVIYEFL